jgi:Bacterial SH3 domain
MVHLERRLDRGRGSLSLALALGLVLSGIACAGKKLDAPPIDAKDEAAPPASPTTSEAAALSTSDEIGRLEAALKNAEEDEARMRDALAERDSELTALEEAKASLDLELQSALEELMRSQASVRNVQSRAFAVSRIAEVRVEVKTFRSAKDPALTDRLDRAEDFLDRADRALQADNVGGSAYLAERASELLRQVRTVAEIRANEPKELIPIVPPRQIVVAAAANLRKGPSSDSERVRAVEPGTTLKAVARQGEWYQVEVEGGEPAWIRRRLIR